MSQTLRDDRVLVADWAERKDPRAFSLLVSKHAALMKRAALVALGSAGRRDPGLADDAVQEACTRLLSAFRTYRGEAEPSTFIASIARRAALDELRKHLRYAAKLERAARLDGTGRQPGNDPALSLEKADIASEVLKALSALPEPDRSLLYFRDAEGMDVAGLSAAFSLPVGTVKSKLARSRAKVRCAIPHLGEGI